jgi:hypothetical protein
MKMRTWTISTAAEHKFSAHENRPFIPQPRTRVVDVQHVLFEDDSDVCSEIEFQFSCR